MADQQQPKKPATQPAATPVDVSASNAVRADQPAPAAKPAATPAPAKATTPAPVAKAPAPKAATPAPKKSGGFFDTVLEMLNLKPTPKKAPAPQKAAPTQAAGALAKATAQSKAPTPTSTKAAPNVKQAAAKKLADTQKPKEDPKKLSADERTAIAEAQKVYQSGITSIRHIIAPDSMEIKPDQLKVSGMHAQTFFVYNYPRFIDSTWLSPVINIDATMDISMFIYPTDSAKIMKFLKGKVTQLTAQIHINQDRGLIRDPALEAAYQDAEELRDNLARGTEKFFEYGLYYTVYAEDPKKLAQVAKQAQSLFGGKLVLSKPARFQMEHAWNTTLPLGSDELYITRNMNTSPLSSTFPFTSSDLTSNEGILYGINRHNDSLVIFDRFKLPNANSVIFATSGAGKSFAIKLEILRSMMLGTDVIVIDPENEYQNLANTVGGTYLNVSLNSDQRINPFDLPKPFQGEIEKPGETLRSAVITLTGMVKLMLGGLSASEESIIDKALIDTYALKGITFDVADPYSMEVPTMMDFVNVLKNMSGAESVAERLEKYTVGTFAGLFNKPTNINLDKGLVVFNIRDLEDSLRPIAMYVIINYIWTMVRSSLKRRMLVVDEAWIMMQHEDSAQFLFGLAKRARKYYLGVTTITQDVEDFVKSKYGKPIVTNSSMQLLLKQSPAAVEPLAKLFNLTEGEKYMLLNSGVGQGLFFAGNKHVAIQIIASYSEKQVVTTNPQELLEQQDTAEGGEGSTTEASV